MTTYITNAPIGGALKFAAATAMFRTIAGALGRRSTLFKLMIICVTTAGITGCGYRLQFAVANTSSMDAVLTVHLNRQAECRLDASVFAFAPAKELKPGWFRRKQPNWVAMQPDSFTLSGETCTFTAPLAANTAMKIAEGYYHPEPKNVELSWLLVQQVSTQWSDGAVQHFKPEELAEQFVEARRRLWAIFPSPDAKQAARVE